MKVVSIVCNQCGQSVGTLNSPNHLLHAILAVLTVGLWVPVWILSAMSTGKPICNRCGRVPDTTPLEAFASGLRVAIVVVLLLAGLVFVSL